MKPGPCEGILGPGMSPNDISLELPACVKIASDEDAAAMKATLDKIVRATAENAASVLASMLGPSAGGQQLLAEFRGRLGVT